MIRQIQYTNPVNGNQKTLDVQCTDTLTYPNGNPIPESPDELWCPVFENIDTATQNIYVLLP